MTSRKLSRLRRRGRLGALAVAPAALFVAGTLTDDRTIRAATWAAVVLFFGFMLERVHQLAANAAEETTTVRREAGYLWSLGGILKFAPSLLPPVGGAAVAPEAAHTLVRLLLTSRPKVIVELGPGASTALIDLARRRSGAQWKHVCVEHSHQYVQILHDYTRDLELDCEVLHAPLKAQQFGSWRGEWYDLEAMVSVPDPIDFLLIDGPPDVDARGRRAGALPALYDQLANDAIVFVDDSNRSGEREMVRRWIASGKVREEYAAEQFTVLRVQKLKEMELSRDG